MHSSDEIRASKTPAPAASASASASVAASVAPWRAPQQRMNARAWFLLGLLALLWAGSFLSNRAALVAALPLNSGASMTLLSIIQARLASDISGLRQSKPDPRQAAVVAGTAVSAPLWRAFARRLIAAMPPLESVIRGGVAYTVTRGVAAVARRVVSGGQNLAREES